MSKKLPLPHGLFALVDDEDFERCARFRWYVGTSGYVQYHTWKSNGSQTHPRLSRFIMNAPKGVNVDHIHGNKLDNRKSELRFCTQQQNSCNRGKGKNNTSGFKGVSWDKSSSKWLSQIMVNRKNIHLGRFMDAPEAASAYAAAALKYHGEFARI